MRKFLRLSIVASLCAVVVALCLVNPVHANEADDCRAAGGVPVSGALSQDTNPDNNCIGSSSQKPIFALVEVGIQYLTLIMGIVAVLMIVISGLQYVLAGTTPDSAKSAKTRLERAVTGLVLFILMFGILQLLLPPDVAVFR